MTRFTSALLGMTVVVATASCASRYQTVTYPPRIDLARHELIGVVEFHSPDEKTLGQVVTARFMESARSDQGMVRMVSLRPEGRRPDPARLRQLAQEHGLRTIVLGELRLSKVRPTVSVSESFSSASLSGNVDATLAVEMIETETGASLWNASGQARASVGDLHVQGAKSVSFGAAGPESAYTTLVDSLVSQVTRDMRGSWERRRIR